MAAKSSPNCVHLIKGFFNLTLQICKDARDSFEMRIVLSGKLAPGNRQQELKQIAALAVMDEDWKVAFITLRVGEDQVFPRQQQKYIDSSFCSLLALFVCLIHVLLPRCLL